MKIHVRAYYVCFPSDRSRAELNQIPSVSEGGHLRRYARTGAGLTLNPGLSQPFCKIH